MSLDNEHDYVLKLVVVGDSGVGKSSLLVRYTDHCFHDTYISTIGVDFKICTLQLGDKKVKLQMWDTAGQERFRSITRSYYRGAQGVIVVYDVSDEQSFQHVETWLEDVEQYSTSPVARIVIGNKCDLDSKRQVSKLRAKEFCRLNNVVFLETSAKTAENVEQSFQAVAQHIVDNIVGSRKSLRSTTPLMVQTLKGEDLLPEKSHCCRSS